jgi:peptide/nickel transport system substrate-binding protein
MTGRNGALASLDGGALHPGIAVLAARHSEGAIDRRGFLRHAAWLGAAVPLAACRPAPPPSSDRLRFVCAIQPIADPALSAWVEASNLYRNALEFLTVVDADNIVRPGLAQSWRPSADLKSWVFTLRPGVRWSTGEALTVADIGFNFARWLAPASQSVNRTALAAINAFEALDDRRFALHLSRPVCSLPEQLFSATCPILHHGFDAAGTKWTDNPVGTGPFRLVDFQVGRQARFERREDYWGTPARLRAIDYIDLGPEIATHVAALAAGQVDILYRIGVSELELIDRLPQARLLRHQAATTLCVRMRVDTPPFDDLRVRRAVQLAADNPAMLRLAHRGHGSVADHHHVAASQPDYGALPPQPRDVPAARALLAAAGHAQGLDLEVVVGNTTGRWEADVTQVLQQNLAEAGIRLKIKVLPATEYWSVWNKVPFGATSWAHRPLGIMTLDLGYRGGSVWNETGFADPGFDALLDEAMGILDPVARGHVMARAEAQLRDAAVMVQPFWPEKFTAVSPRVRGHVLHPADYFRMDRVWLA